MGSASSHCNSDANMCLQAVQSFEESNKMYAIPAETASQGQPFQKENLPGPGKFYPTYVLCHRLSILAEHLLHQLVLSRQSCMNSKDWILSLRLDMHVSNGIFHDTRRNVMHTLTRFLLQMHCKHAQAIAMVNSFSFVKTAAMSPRISGLLQQISGTW